jgi:hypothetical protein
VRIILDAFLRQAKPDKQAFYDRIPLRINTLPVCGMVLLPLLNSGATPKTFCVAVTAKNNHHPKSN